jgi:phosphonate transport system substrate-binding protein
MNDLLFSSIQAPNADPICGRIVNWVGEHTGLNVQFVDNLPWQEREQRFETGEIQAIWMCGLPYILRADQGDQPIELLAAPVMVGERYQHQPVYFSDVVVSQDSPFKCFADLRGASWAYNEPHSHSGYNVTRYHLALIGEPKGFFGRVVQAGAHQTALEMVLDGRIDASAIDSTVLEAELRLRPEIAERLRVIEHLGPSPIPPWVIHQDMPQTLRDAVRQAFLSMHTYSTGQEILSTGSIERFASVQDRDYDLIREMTRKAKRVQL